MFFHIDGDSSHRHLEHLRLLILTIWYSGACLHSERERLTVQLTEGKQFHEYNSCQTDVLFSRGVDFVCSREKCKRQFTIISGFTNSGILEKEYILSTLLLLLRLGLFYTQLSNIQYIITSIVFNSP